MVNPTLLALFERSLQYIDSMMLRERIVEAIRDCAIRAGVDRAIYKAVLACVPATEVLINTDRGFDGAALGVCVIVWTGLGTGTLVELKVHPSER